MANDIREWDWSEEVLNRKYVRLPDFENAMAHMTNNYNRFEQYREMLLREIRESRQVGATPLLYFIYGFSVCLTLIILILCR